MRDERDFERALEAIADGSIRRCGVPKSTLERAVEKMLRVYGHSDLVALAEVDALYANLGDAAAAPGANLRDADVTQTRPESA